MDKDEWPRIHKEPRFWRDIAMTLSCLGVASVFMGPVTTAAHLLTAQALFRPGMAAWAKREGRHPAWGLMGLSCLVGVLVLCFLPKRCRGGERMCLGRSFDCPDCGAPM